MLYTQFTVLAFYHAGKDIWSCIQRLLLYMVLSAYDDVSFLSDSQVMEAENDGQKLR